MTLLGINDSKILAFVNNLLYEGWILKRVSFHRGYLRVGYGRVEYSYDCDGYDLVDVFVPNRRTRQQSNCYHAVIHLVKPVDLPF